MKYLPENLGNYITQDEAPALIQLDLVPEIEVHLEALSGIDAPTEIKRQWLRALHLVAASFADEAFRSQPIETSFLDKPATEHRGAA